MRQASAKRVRGGAHVWHVLVVGTDLFFETTHLGQEPLRVDPVERHATGGGPDHTGTEGEKVAVEMPEEIHGTPVVGERLLDVPPHFVRRAADPKMRADARVTEVASAAEGREVGVSNLVHAYGT